MNAGPVCVSWWPARWQKRWQKRWNSACDLYPVLLLLDLRLPDGDGRALLPMLRRIPGCETAPAVAVTAEIALQTALRRVGGTYPMHEVPRLLAIFSQRLVRPPH